MLDNVLNFSSLTLIVAIAAGIASFHFESSPRRSAQASPEPTAAAAQAASAPVVQLPMVVVVGHRPQAPIAVSRAELD